eukprot:1866405-Rhodomonas_salina.1
MRAARAGRVAEQHRRVAAHRRAEQVLPEAKRNNPQQPSLRVHAAQGQWLFDELCRACRYTAQVFMSGNQVEPPLSLFYAPEHHARTRMFRTMSISARNVLADVHKVFCAAVSAVSDIGIDGGHCVVRRPRASPAAVRPSGPGQAAIWIFFPDVT